MLEDSLVDWKEIANFGVVFLCLAGLAWAVWIIIRAVGGWASAKLTPIADAHLRLITTMQEQVPQQTRALEQHTLELAAQNAMLKQLVTTNHEQHLQLLKISADQELAVHTEKQCVDSIKEARAELEKQTAELRVHTAQADRDSQALAALREALESHDQLAREYINQKSQ